MCFESVSRSTNNRTHYHTVIHVNCLPNHRLFISIGVCVHLHPMNFCSMEIFCLVANFRARCVRWPKGRQWFASGCGCVVWQKRRNVSALLQLITFKQREHASNSQCIHSHSRLEFSMAICDNCDFNPVIRASLSTMSVHSFTSVCVQTPLSHTIWMGRKFDETNNHMETHGNQTKTHADKPSLTSFCISHEWAVYPHKMITMKIHISLTADCATINRAFTQELNHQFID